MYEVIITFILLFGLALIFFFTSKSIHSVKPADSENYNKKPQKKKKALTGLELRQTITDLPQAKVISVIDGDTVVVKKGWSTVKIRLDSIDCPEDGQPWGDTAKFGLIKMIGGKNIRLEEHGYDDYGRLLATLLVYHTQKNEWLNVNERMVTLGHAWVMRRYYDHLPSDRQNKLNSTERWAKTKKVGLWQHPKPIPPWQWRKGTNKKKVA